MAKIMVVDDDEELLKTIKKILEKENHLVKIFQSTSEVTSQDLMRCELLLLDIMMPDEDGFSFCQRIRNTVSVPIIFLTAKSDEADVLSGLSLGADDYISKPFSIDELRARVNAHLRREAREPKSGLMSANGIYMNILSKEIFYQETKIPFTKSEYKICHFLLINSGQVFSKEEIVEKVFGFEKESDELIIAEHIKNIRAKLKKVNINCIETVWGMGYKWQKGKVNL